MQELKDGRTILVSNQPLANGGWVDLQEDITEKRRAEQKITWLARHDTLTEIANRFHFREELEHALRDLQPHDGFAVHWIDLDKFKDVNDTYGHPVGDQLLKSVARRLRETVRGPDLIGRLGGDEFAVLQRQREARERRRAAGGASIARHQRAAPRRRAFPPRRGLHRHRAMPPSTAAPSTSS